MEYMKKGLHDLNVESDNVFNQNCDLFLDFICVQIRKIFGFLSNFDPERNIEQFLVVQILRPLRYFQLCPTPGDLWSYQFEHEDYLISPEPDITHHIIDPEFHRFLIIGSDGLWNMMSVYDAVRHADRYSWERVNKVGILIDRICVQTRGQFHSR